MKKRYLVVYGKVKGSNFSGHAPDVLGCVSAGETLEEMRAMMLEALTAHFEFMAEDGETAPDPFTTTIDLPPSDFDDVEYFIVEQLDVPVPMNVNTTKRIPRHQIAAAA